MKRIIPAIVFYGLLFALTAAVTPAAQPSLDLAPEEKAFIEAHPVIRYSDKDWRPLTILQDGRMTGLLADYYALLAQKTGLAFQFDPVGDGHDFQPVLTALREKRIDMIDGAATSATRAEYALPVGPFLHFPLAVMTRDGAKVTSLSALTGKRVAAGQGGTAAEYLKAHGANIELIETRDASEALSLVALGKADAAVENLAVATAAIRGMGLSNVRIAGQLDDDFAVYALVRKDWPQLASILAKAQKLVTESEKAALVAKWLPDVQNGLPVPEKVTAAGHSALASPGEGTIPMTDRERAYLARKKVLTFCVDPDWPPVERIDENGHYVGIAADFLSLLGERLGARLELVPTASWSQSVAAAKARRCDFLPAAGDTKDRRRFLHFTSPYLHFPMVVATAAKAPFVDDPSSLAGKTLGVVNGYASLDILRAKYPHLHLMEVSSVAEGLKLVADGRLYGYIDTVPAISQAIAKGHFSDLKIAGRLEAHLDLSVGSRDDEPELASLFQKAVNTLTKEESDAILKKWVAVTFEQGFDYALVWKVLAGATCIVLMVVWWNRKLSRLNRALRQANAERDAAAQRVTALLDNAGQGFLSVDVAGTVDPQYSAECRHLFAQDIAGKSVAALLYPDDPAGAKTMVANIRRVIEEADPYRRDLYLSLMPKVLVRAGGSLRLAYRPLGEARLMFVITDISGEVRLKDAVARERNRLACVVAAVREQRDFFAVLDEFAAFRRQKVDPAPQAPDARSALDIVYRQVHTFKGLFLQLECAHVAKALHALEQQLAGLRGSPFVSRDMLLSTLADPAVGTALEEDLAVVREVLGEEFFEHRGEVSLGSALADALVALAGRWLQRKDALGLSSEDAAILEAARTLRYVDLKRLLSGYPRAALRLAEGQGKRLVPFAVEGDTVLVDPVGFAPLVKSLIHGIRNAVDHGLETPEEREEAGKSPEGHVSCRVEAAGETTRILLAEDGRGVDVAAIRARAFELGLVGAEDLAGMDDAMVLNLLFLDGFTSRRVAGELSGRGVGLAAIRAEAERLGGTVAIENQPGQGMRLIVTVPRTPHVFSPEGV